MAANTTAPAAPANDAAAQRVDELAAQGRAYGLGGLYDIAAQHALDGEWDIANMYLEATARVLAENAYRG